MGQDIKNIEADAYNPQTDSEIVFTWNPSGYIRSDDWSDVDADDFLRQMKENDAEADKIRASKGIPTLTTVGWREKPHFNPDTHTVSWSINAIDRQHRS